MRGAHQHHGLDPLRLLNSHVQQGGGAAAQADGFEPAHADRIQQDKYVEGRLTKAECPRRIGGASMTTQVGCDAAKAGEWLLEHQFPIALSS